MVASRTFNRQEGAGVIQPMRLLRMPEPFDHEDFIIFEPKIDGFQALAHLEQGRCTLVSPNGNVFKSWPQLRDRGRL